MLSKVKGFYAEKGSLLLFLLLLSKRFSPHRAEGTPVNGVLAIVLHLYSGGNIDISTLLAKIIE